MTFEHVPAPLRTEWGAGMVEVLVELSKDATASVYLHRDDLPLLEAALRNLLVETP